MKKTSCFLVFTAILSVLTACGGNFDERLKEEARAFTRKNCPQQLDGVTRLDSAAYDMSSRTYWRYFSLAPEAEKAIRENAANIRNGLLMELKNDAAWKACKDEKVKFGYVYSRAKSREEIIRIVFGPSDYQ